MSRGESTSRLAERHRHAWHGFCKFAEAVVVPRARAVDTGQERPDAPMRRRTAFAILRQHSGQYFHFAGAVGEGLMIGVGFSEDYLPWDLPVRLAVSIEAGLVRLADGAANSLGEMPLDPLPGRSLDPDGAA